MERENFKKDGTTVEETDKAKTTTHEHVEGGKPEVHEKEVVTEKKSE